MRLGPVSAVLAGAAIALALAGGASALALGLVATQKGNLRVTFSGSLAPKKLPRHGAAPISVRLGGRISTTDGSDPPPLARIELAFNRAGRLDPRAVPTCRLEDIQPASTAYAHRVCGGAEIGDGSFEAAVAIPEQSPYPSQGEVSAFNGRIGGKPVVLLHVYGTEPLPTSFTLPMQVERGRGRFGTVLRGSLPSIDARVAFVTALSLRLGRAPRGGGRGYLSAGCPAPDGFHTVPFALARASFGFADGVELNSVLEQTCTANH